MGLSAVGAAVCAVGALYIAHSRDMQALRERMSTESRIAPSRFGYLRSTLPADASTAAQADALAGMIDRFEPVTGRTDGLRNEAAAIDPRTHCPLAEISAPTLVIHARDDGINPIAFGEYTARHIAGAEFMPLASGGHLLLGHRSEVRARVRAFLHAQAVAGTHSPMGSARRE